MRAPLPLSQDDWRSRWLYLPSSDILHRISEMEWKDVDEYSGSLVHGGGISVCGTRGFFDMPGMFSRMGAPRCKKCCRLLGIQEGNGAPFNSLKGKGKNA